MRLFTNSVNAARIGSEMLRLVSFSEPFFGLMIVLEGISYGMGRTKHVFACEAVSMWGIRLTLASLLAPHFGLMGVWMAMSFELTMRGVLFLVRLVRGRWLDKGALA